LLFFFAVLLPFVVNKDYQFSLQPRILGNVLYCKLVPVKKNFSKSINLVTL